MANDPQLLAAIASGGQLGRDQYQAAKQADQASQQQAVASALQLAQGLGAPAGASQAVNSIIAQPYNNAAQYSAGMDRYNQAALSSKASALAEFQRNNVAINALMEQKVKDEIAKKIHDAFAGTQSLSSDTSGGSGDYYTSDGGSSSSGSSRSRSSSSSSSVKSSGSKSSDWIKQIRSDAGLDGTGLSSAKYVKRYLDAASLAAASDNPDYIDMPRDLRSRQFAVDYYGADPNLLDAVAPVGGFLKEAKSDLAKFKNGTLEYTFDNPNYGKVIKTGPDRGKVDHRKTITEPVNTVDLFAFSLRQKARGLPGNQIKAVDYIVNQIRQQQDAAKAQAVGDYIAARAAAPPPPMLEGPGAPQVGAVGATDLQQQVGDYIASLMKPKQLAAAEAKKAAVAKAAAKALPRIF